MLKTFDMLPSSDPSEIVYVDSDKAVIIPNDAKKLSSGKARQVEIKIR